MSIRKCVPHGGLKYRTSEVFVNTCVQCTGIPEIYILEPPPPGWGKKFQPMSLAGKNIKSGREKGDNVKEKGDNVKEKGRKGKEKGRKGKEKGRKGKEKGRKGKEKEGERIREKGM
jgi:hypothetical protein